MDENTRAVVARILGCSTDDLSGVGEEIDGVIELYRHNKSEIDAMPVRSERRNQLNEFNAALSVISRQLPAVELVFSGTKEYETLLEISATFQNIVQQMLNEKSAHGRDPDDRMWLLGKLAEIFCRITGEQITNTYDAIDDKFRGKFFDFARAVLPLSDFSNIALGALIRDWNSKNRPKTK